MSRRATGSRPARSTPARSPTRAPARSCRRSALATTFAQDAVGKHRGYEYARSGNPTRTALETCLASLEGAGHGLAFASGLAAEDAILRTLDPGDHVIIPTDAYGGTFRLVARVHERHGIAWTAVDLARPRRARRPRGATRPAWSGSRRRPTRCSSIVDIAAVAQRRARARARASSSTTRSRRRTSSSRSRSAPTSSVHSSDEVPRRPLRRRRRLRRASTTPSSPTSCGSCRTRWARCRRRSTATSCCAGVKTLAVRMDRALRERARDRRRCCASTTRSRGCCYPGCRPPRPRRRAPARCATSAAWCRSSRGGEDAALDVVAPHAPVHARRVARRGRVADRAPGAHDPRVGRRLAARGRPALVRLSVGIETADDLVADLRRPSTRVW